eukprot:TRINITY_DN429_c0_g1_i2.p4 TRINITY_DN429_c0_g1~~TRINITY_DN429_c0_g1_i2.p4  ORF type:complete len:58 (-),score=13.25 TRINITY_DN429_c0_g1_i2:878-1051(-)
MIVMTGVAAGFGGDIPTINIPSDGFDPSFKPDGNGNGNGDGTASRAWLVDIGQLAAF